MPKPLPRLDWAPHHDQRSRAFPVRRTATPEDAIPRQRLWKPGVALDQGSEGACVGFGWVGETLATPRAHHPIPVARANAYARNRYDEAKRLDDWPGEDYDGTSVLAGAKAMEQDGWIEGYRWCFGLDDVRYALMTSGPVVIGIPWYQSMYATLNTHEVVVSGPQVGGHCILLTGYAPSHARYRGREMYRWRNSWGVGYGAGGSAWIDAAVLRDLLADNGEACVPERRTLGRVSV